MERPPPAPLAAALPPHAQQALDASLERQAALEGQLVLMQKQMALQQEAFKQSMEQAAQQQAQQIAALQAAQTAALQQQAAAQATAMQASQEKQLEMMTQALLQADNTARANFSSLEGRLVDVQMAASES